MKHRNDRQNRRFALWLARARDAVPLTQGQLAEYLHVSQATISYWETDGRLSMEPQEIIDLARLLRVNPVEVAAALGYPTNPPSAPPITVPFSADEWMRRVAQLNENLERAMVRETEQWAEAQVPPEAGGRERNGRSG
jgi:transcriptional regulator with XRE-family HTH domain